MFYTLFELSTDKPKEKVGQTSNNSMGEQCFGC